MLLILLYKLMILELFISNFQIKFIKSLCLLKFIKHSQAN